MTYANPLYGLRCIQHDTVKYEMVQYRFPKSKKRRIRKKFAKKYTRLEKREYIYLLDENVLGSYLTCKSRKPSEVTSTIPELYREPVRMMLSIPKESFSRFAMLNLNTTEGE